MSELTKHWITQGNSFYFQEIPSVSTVLPIGIYQLQWGDIPGFYLDKVSSDFQLPKKLYGFDDEFIKRVIMSFNKLNKNFGVLLKGLKGTGKTIVAKQISARLNLPVILITKPYSDFGSFLNTIDQDVILLFDEFEKIYEFFGDDSEDDEGNITEKGATKKNVSNLLTLMDGVFTSKYKRLFLLTTNKEWLPDAMVARPSRIRYVKDFSDLSAAGISEILNDSVINKELIPGLIELLKTQEIITVDIVKAIAEEANIYETSDHSLFSIMNLKKIDTYYDVFELNGKKEVLLEPALKFDFNSKEVRNYISIGGCSGYIKEIDREMKTITIPWTDGKEKTVKTFVFKTCVKLHQNMSDFVL